MNKISCLKYKHLFSLFTIGYKTTYLSLLYFILSSYTYKLLFSSQDIQTEFCYAKKILKTWKKLQRRHIYIISFNIMK